MKDGEAKAIPDDQIILQAITHVCVAVDDVEKTAKLYSRLFGIGPWTVRQVHTPSSRAKVHGKPTSYTLNFGYAKAGAITLELVETVQGDSVYREFLERHGEGIHHIGFNAPTPLDAELAKWKALGIEALQVNYRDDPRYGWAYMDTSALVGCLLEIVCDPMLGWWESAGLLGMIQGK